MATVKIHQVYAAGPAAGARVRLHQVYFLTDPGSTASPPPLHIVGVIGADALSEMNTAAAAGATAVVIQAFWDRLQTSSGAALVGAEVTALKGLFADAATAGLQVVLECATQYPPAWAKTAIPKFKDQDAGEWTSASPGDDVRDWVFSAVGKTAVDDFITKTWQALSAPEKSQVVAIRQGFGLRGENQYPLVGANPRRWWGFSAPAQTGTDLAPDQVVCPLPGHIPFNGTALGVAGSANDLAWVAWYTNAATVRLTQQVSLYRSLGFNGRILVMHPNFGVRSNWTSADTGWREQKAAGCDWAHQMDSYKNSPSTYPYSTWIDAPHAFEPPSVASDYAAWDYLEQLASARGFTDLWGENTGGQNNTDMDRIFSGAAGAVQSAGYKGIFWLNHDSLASGTDDTYAHLATFTGDVDFPASASIRLHQAYMQIAVASAGKMRIHQVYMTTNAASGKMRIHQVYLTTAGTTKVARYKLLGGEWVATPPLIKIGT